jgi:Tol biopolymer transport system component
MSSHRKAGITIASVVLCVWGSVSATNHISFIAFAQSTPKESVRAELIRLQAQEGLTLAHFYRGISFVNFTHRWETPTKESFVEGTGVELEGAITRDGNDIAFDLFRATGKASLGVIHRDGRAFQGFPNISAPYELCWSYDKSHLAISAQVPATQYKPSYMNLALLNIDTKDTQQVGDGGFVTSQCWSADGRHIVYEADDSIRVYDIDRKESRVLAKGKYPTWSSDGQWLAFLDNDTYYAVTPSGEGRRVLFKTKKAFSGLWWSPDPRIVAYLSQNKIFEGPLIIDIEPVRLRVRRLADGSEDWVTQDFLSYLPNYQWVTNKDLVNIVESSAHSK